MGEDADDQRVGLSIKLSGSKSYYLLALGPDSFSSLNMEKIETPASEGLREEACQVVSPE